MSLRTSGRNPNITAARPFNTNTQKGTKMRPGLPDGSLAAGILLFGGFRRNGQTVSTGFTYERYRDGIIANMAALKRAFPRSITMQYANFMPGEWLPWKNGSYLESVYRSARQLGVGVGGPDLLPYRKGQMNHGYVRIRECSGKVPTGIAVQEGNYDYINLKTGRRVTVRELFEFATDYLHVEYLFWFAQEPFYRRDVLPFLSTPAVAKPS